MSPCVTAIVFDKAEEVAISCDWDASAESF
jgi:hypothetical protein